MTIKNYFSFISFMLAAFTANTMAADADIKIQKLNEHLYVLFGPGGNIAASIGDDGIYIVDDKFAKLSDNIKKKLTSLKPGAAEFVINTHHHGDHTGGNENFAASGSHIISHDNVRQRLKDEHGEGSKFLPVISFSTDISLHFNQEHAEIVHYPNAHTDGDVIVFFKQANIVHMGDIYFNLGGLPFIDVDSGGSVDGILAAVTDVLTKIDANTQVIPGHGAMSNKSGLSSYHKLLTNAKTLVLTAMQGNKTEQEVIASRPLGSLNLTYSDWLPQQRVTKLFFQSLSSKPQIN